jgi:transposase
MDGVGGYKTAATTALPDAVTVMNPFHVVALAGTKLDLCRHRVQQDTLGHRGRTGDPLYRLRRALRTRTALLTSNQQARLAAVFAAEEHIAVELTWRGLPADHRRPPRPRAGKTLLTTVIDMIRAGLPAGLEELAQLGRTPHRRRTDVLAYFAHRASNGPTEAINGRLEALRRNALGFRNMINYRIRSRTLDPEEPLFETGRALPDLVVLRQESMSRPAFTPGAKPSASATIGRSGSLTERMRRCTRGAVVELLSPDWGAYMRR